MRCSNLLSSKHLSALLAGCVLLPAALAQTSFQAHTIAQSPNLVDVVAHGDFNNDGREDLIVRQGSAPGLLYLSNGDGTYQAPLTLSTIGDRGFVAVGDFNHDGKLDYVAPGATGSQLAVYLGNGDGTFQPRKTVQDSGYASEMQFGVVAVDLNHDNKTDLVQGTGPSTMQIWISNGDGTFTAGQRFLNTNQIVFPLLTGDFDADGKPDVAIMSGDKGQSTLQVFWGDGAGHLGSPYSISDPNFYEDVTQASSVGDFNNDGRSDVVTVPFTYGVSGTSQFYPMLRVFEGNSNRTVTIKDIPTSQCPGSAIALADFTGDGINDLFYDEGPCTSGATATDSYVVKAGTGSGNFAAEQTVYQNTVSASNSLSLDVGWAIRSSLGTKPDMVFTKPNSSNSTTSLVLLSNSSAGSFPGCGVTVADGIRICSPGTTANSPVKFSIGATGPTPMRTAAVWVDGKKVAEQLAHAFSNYSFLDISTALTAGSHAIAIYGVGWDNTLQQKSFTLQVGSGGGTCTAPSTPGVNVCSPVNGSAVGSPVGVQAASTITGTLARMEVWVDGVKKFTESTSKSFTTSIALGAGSHRFDIYAVNTAGTKWEKTVIATVQ